ncbi:MAG: flagellar motor protein MotA, partial [Acidiferrobacterales bacterium]
GGVAAVTDPKRMLIWMLLFLAAAAVVGAALFAPLRSAFEANQVFNGMILGVLAIGIIINFLQVFTLGPATDWIEDSESGTPPEQAPRLLAPMAKIFSGREQEGFRLSAMAMRSLLDGIRLRLDESRDISRYLIGLLIFLGLLGTFWGLLDTVFGVGSVIAGLSAGTGDLSTVFEELKRDLQGPLLGMGTAFSSSLFGLGGALVLGILDLQAGHAQNRFYNNLEEWLSGMTHLPSGKLTVEGDHPLPTYVEALLEQTADNLNQLQRTMARGEEDRRAAQASSAKLTEQLAELTDQMRSEQKLLLNLAKNQTDLQPTMAELANQVTTALTGYEEMRDHLRSVDVALTRLLEEVSAARHHFGDEFRKEIRLLAQSLGKKTARSKS